MTHEEMSEELHTYAAKLGHRLSETDLEDVDQRGALMVRLAADRNILLAGQTLLLAMTSNDAHKAFGTKRHRIRANHTRTFVKHLLGNSAQE